MKLTCNLGYSRNDESHRKQIRAAITLLWKSGNRNSVAQKMAAYKINDTPKAMVLDKVASEDAADLIQVVQSKICELDNNSLETLSDKARTLLNDILSQFFEMDSNNIITKVDVQESSAGMTDEYINQIANDDIKRVADEIYGISSGGLLKDLQSSFTMEMQQRLLYDSYTATVHQLSKAQVNSKILEYKQQKFNTILQFLKKVYNNPNSHEYARLQQIKELYTYGYVNHNSYKYVTNLFLRYLKSQNNLQETLSKEYMDKLIMSFETTQTQKFNKLLRQFKELYPTWYKNNITESEEKQQFPMYIAGRYSKYYQKVKSKIAAELQKEPNNLQLQKFKEQIQEIESPNNAILETVQDFLKLTHFDDLVRVAFSDTLSYNRAKYSDNAMSYTLLDQKYDFKQSKKHQNSGYENTDKDNSETHTGATVKTIISSLAIYKYTDPAVPTSSYMEMKLLIQGWQALAVDVLQGNFKIGNEDLERQLKELISNRERPIENITKVLEILFKKANLSKLRGARQTTTQTLNNLFSFYQQVLNTENPDSIKSLELAKFNGDDYNGQFLPVTSALVAVLYRNVNNNFIDCYSDKNFKVKARFNWDRDLFDLIEGCNFPSKLRQSGLMDLETVLIDRYKFGVRGDQAYITIGDTTLQFTHGRKFKRLKFLDYSRMTVTPVGAANGNILEKARKASLESFIVKKFGGGQLDENETALLKLLQFIDYYTGIGFLNNESMMEALRLYKENYTQWHQEAKIPFGNYLTYFLNMAVGIASADYDAYNAKKRGKSLREYYNGHEGLYQNVYTAYKKGSYRSYINQEGRSVSIVPVSNYDVVLTELAKYKVVAEGRSVKSTSKNKSNDSVSNYTISRRGSELPSIIQEMTKAGENFVGNSLLFIKDPSLINVDPVVDGEITTLTGEVKAVSQMTPTELIQHALLDKFYFSYLKRDQICFQPTVYSDKGQFLNYFGNVIKDANSQSFMSFGMDNFEEECIKLYQTTFFMAHQNMFQNSIDKINKIMNFSITGRLDDNTGNRNSAQSFLREHVYNGSNEKEGLFQVVTRYNNAVADYNRQVRNYNKTVQDQIKKKQSIEEVELELDKDYRVLKDNGVEYCDLNEISEFYANLSFAFAGSKEMLHSYFEQQKRIFVQDLKNSRMNLRIFTSKEQMQNWIKFDPDKQGTEGQYSSYILNILSSTKLLNYGKQREQFVKNWVDSDTGELILQDENGKLNPFFEKFFYIEGIYTNNLRLMLSGSEVNHPNSQLKFSDTLYHQLKSTETNEELLTKLLEEGIISESIDDLQLQEIRQILNNTLNIRDLRGSSNKIIQNIYVNGLSTIINLSQGTQFKRNVIIPATLQHLIPGKIDGVSDEVLAAVIEDEKAPVNNLRESDSIDASDGSARMSPIQVYLENASLDDQRVGTNRKPIWGQIGNGMTLFEAKFAAFGMTNQEILNSMNSSTSLYRLFKKMHNLRWNEEIDLTHSIRSKEGSTATKDEILQWFNDVILQQQGLYYNNIDGDIVEICGFGVDKKLDKKVYYTLEKKAGIVNAVPTKVYHYFDDFGNHYSKLNFSATTNSKGEPIHTIDSLYELYVALGGAYNCDSNGNSADTNLMALTNFVTNVGYKVSDKILSIDDVVQPLRKKFIAYAFNHTAVKCGAKNINPKEYWGNDSALTTFTVKTSGLGIQLNADHNADESELTEFSQVIAACSAYGKNFDSVDEIYQGLAQSALEESSDELQSINEFLAANDEKAKYKLYKIIAKLILRASSTSEYDLGAQVKYEIDRAFNDNKNKAGNILKVPFSDPSFYNQFITSITSVINRKSIKRKHPGTGYVMSPGYNVVQHYQVWNGEEYVPYMYEDVLRKARDDYRGKLITLVTALAKNSNTITLDGTNIRISMASLSQLSQYVRSRRVNLENLINTNTNNKTPEQIKQQQDLNAEYQYAIGYLNIDTQDTQSFNNQLVASYLNKRQQQESYRHKSWFMPTDNVRISTNNGDIIYNMDAMDDFYRFKDRLPVKEATEKQYDVTIVEEKDGKIRIKLNELKHPTNPKLDQEFVLERDPESEGLSYFIHFRTGEVGPQERRVLSADRLSNEQKTRLFQAALERLPIGATLSLSPTTVEQQNSGKGGLSYLSIAGFNSLNPNQADLYKAIAETDKIKEEDKPIMPDQEAIDRRQNRQPERIGGATIQLVGEYQPVWYFDNENKLKQTLVGKYKKVAQQDNYKYKLDVTRPVNLKPSLIRWAYEYENKEGAKVKTYMTIYDHPIIKASWNQDKSKRPTRAQIQKVLDDLEKGYFYLNGKRYQVLDGSLENTEAELVMGNMYASLFGIEGESLAQVLEKGENYFKEKAGNKYIPTLPTGFYDLAFTKDSGDHTLIALGTIDESNGIEERAFDQRDEIVNEEGEIYYKDIKIGKYVDAPDNWKIIEKDGEFNVVQNSNVIPKQDYMIENPGELNMRVKKRVNFVRRYIMTRVQYDSYRNPKYNKYTLYKIADVNEIKEALNRKSKDNSKEYTEEEMRKAAMNQVSAILKHLYDRYYYTDLVINTSVGRKDHEDSWIRRVDNVRSRQYLYECLGNSFATEMKKENGELVAKDPKQLTKFENHILNIKKLLIEKGATFDFVKEYEKELKAYHETLQGFTKKWASFLTSLHFIASRIPAQSLQSFMPMKCVGWLSGTSNTAYVSYIQTYLQGSDYDIDKAYIMGQSFTDGGQYIGWSNLFDYSSVQTIEASKTLPTPKGYKLQQTNDEAYKVDKPLGDLLNQITKLAKTKQQLDNDPGNVILKRERLRLRGEVIRAYAKLITKIDQQKGKYYITIKAPLVKEILSQIQKHENYKIPYSVRSQAYKNVASANIFNNVHNIRNRDQAYSPITMKDLRKSADHSPKGNRVRFMSMINPITKYHMQYENIMGRRDIGIMANGEKVWFNLTYYYHNLLRFGDTSDDFFLKMSRTYERIKGRSKGFPIPNTVHHIPDLWGADGYGLTSDGKIDKKTLNGKVATRLKELFYKEVDIEEVDDVYVDQIISQLLSAATDNAKELILAKINAGTEFAKYYLHLIIMGYSLDDVVSFMTSPAVELVDKYSSSDDYSGRTNTVKTALSLLKGDINLNVFMPAEKSSYSNGKLFISDPEELAAYEEALAAMATAQAEAQQEAEESENNGTQTLTQSNLYSDVISALGSIYKEANAINLKDFIKKYILANTSEETDKEPEYYNKLRAFRISSVKVQNNYKANSFLKFVDSLIDDVKDTVNNYNKKSNNLYTLQDFINDLNQFDSLQGDADETTTLASVWLKFNQGIPQTDVEIIKRIKRMNDTVSTRENEFGISKVSRNIKKYKITLQDDQTKEDKNEIDQSKQEAKRLMVNAYNVVIKNGVTIDKKLQRYIDIITKIKQNNQMLTYEEIVSILLDAIDADLYGNFNVYEFLKDSQVVLQPRNSLNYDYYKDQDGAISSNIIGYRELAARYYNLIKGSWNILDIVRRIPHYKLNMDLFNYTLQARQIFAMKTKITDTLLSMANLQYMGLSDSDYKIISRYADSIINTSFFFQLKTPIPLNSFTDVNKPLPNVYNEHYQIVSSEFLSLDSLHGMDSLKHFVEHEFLQYLKEHHSDNFLVQALILRSNRGVTNLRTTLNLDEINASLNNQQTYAKYLKAVNELALIKVKDVDGLDTQYSLADILALYNLAIYGTRAGGKNLTAVFKDSVTKTIIHDYYEFLGNDADYESNASYIYPTKTDLLIALAPIVYTSNNIDNLHTEPYVKVASTVKRFDLYERFYDQRNKRWKYRKVDFGKFLSFTGDMTSQEREEAVSEYLSNAINLFPQLHDILVRQSIITLSTIDNNFNRYLSLIKSDIKSNKVRIIQRCD